MKTKLVILIEYWDHFCLYPTFKEWKPWFHLYNSSSSHFSLYPTFKEWKHRRISPFPAGSISLYPTFKEWKQESEKQ